MRTRVNQLMNARTLVSLTVDSYCGQEEKLVFRIDFEHTVVPLPRGTCRLACMSDLVHPLPVAQLGLQRRCNRTSCLAPRSAACSGNVAAKHIH